MPPKPRYYRNGKACQAGGSAAGSSLLSRYHRSPSPSSTGLTQPARLRGGGTGAPPGSYRGLGAPRTVDRAPFRGLEGRWGCKQAGDPALCRILLPVVPLDVYPNGEMRRERPASVAPSQPPGMRGTVLGNHLPNPPRTPRAGPRVPWGRSRSAARAAPPARDGVAGGRR